MTSQRSKEGTCGQSHPVEKAGIKFKKFKGIGGMKSCRNLGKKGGVIYV